MVVLPKADVFANDLVEDPNHPGAYGLIWRVAGDTEDDLSEEESEELADKLADDHVEIAWLDESAADYTKTTIQTDDLVDVRHCSGLRVVDRSLHIGDIVAHRDNPLAQMGVVKEVSRMVDVRLSDGRLLQGLPSSVLKPIVPFCPDQFVIYANWLARVHSIWETMQVQLADGTLIEVYGSSETQVLAPASPLDHTFHEDSLSCWYPGQRVLLMATLSQLKYSKSVKIKERGRGTARPTCGVILTVQADELEVEWVAPLPGAISASHPPLNANIIRAKHAVPLTAFCFGPTTWNLGSRGIFNPEGFPPDAPEEPGCDLDSPMARPETPPAPSSPRPTWVPRDESDAHEDGHALRPPHRGETRGWEEAPPDERPELSQPHVGHGQAISGGPGQATSDGRGPSGHAAVEELEGGGDAQMQGMEGGAVCEDADGWGSEEEDGGGPRTEGADCAGPAGAACRGSDAQAGEAVAEAEGGGGEAAAGQVVEQMAAGPDAADGDNPLHLLADAAGHVSSRPGDTPPPDPKSQEGAGKPSWTKMLFNWGNGLLPGYTNRVGLPVVPVPETPAKSRRAGSVPASRRRASKKVGKGPARLSLPKKLPVTALVVRTHTRATVLWQDGRVTEDVPSTDLIIRNHVDDHDFWPEEYVVEGPDDFDQEHGGSTQMQRVGLVKRVDHQARTAVVTWLTDPAGGSLHLAAASAHLDGAPEESVSVYSVMAHPEEQFVVADVVLNLAWEQLPGGLPELQKSSTAAAACVGEVLGWCKGLVRVAWADGSLSAAPPDQLFLLSRGDEESADMAPPEWDPDDYASNGTGGGSGSEHGSADSLPPGRSNEDDAASYIDSADPRHQHVTLAASGDVMDLDGELDGCSDDFAPVPGSPARDLHQPPPVEDAAAPTQVASAQTPEAPVAAAVESAAAASEGLEAAPKVGPDSTSQQQQQQLGAFAGALNWATGGVNNIVNLLGTAACQDVFVQEALDQEPSAPDARGGKSEEVLALPAPGVEPCTAAQEPASERSAPAAPLEEPHFRVLEEVPRDHYYLDSASGNPLGKRFQKSVLREWAMLQAGLPPSIWVAVFESRMDLMRAVLTGAEGTPYHHQLFVFDLQLAEDHPATAPSVHYHSWGLRINPNLYENGKVCLSLLNTWMGRTSEVWDPSSSTLLQVLVSIQGLVLVPKPYYNEAGYEKHMGTWEGEANSRLYNESAFLLTAQSMLRLLARPPPPFGPLIKEHYKRAAPRLLEACEVYLTGTTPVGSFLSGGPGSPAPPVPQTPLPPAACPPSGAVGPATPTSGPPILIGSSPGEDGAPAAPAVPLTPEKVRAGAEELRGGTGGTSPRVTDVGEGNSPGASPQCGPLGGTGGPVTPVPAVPAVHGARIDDGDAVVPPRPGVGEAPLAGGGVVEGSGPGCPSQGSGERADACTAHAGAAVHPEGPAEAEAAGGAEASGPGSAAGAGPSGAPSEGFRLSLRRLMPRIESALAALEKA